MADQHHQHAELPAVLEDEPIDVNDIVIDRLDKRFYPLAGDHVAVASENGKFLVFPLDELPEMSRGKGVRIQKYKQARGRQGTLELDGGLSDLTTFNLEQGLSWQMGGGRTRTETELGEWLGKRAGVGKKPPHGFPRNNRFSD